MFQVLQFLHKDILWNYPLFMVSQAHWAKCYYHISTSVVTLHISSVQSVSNCLCACTPWKFKLSETPQASISWEQDSLLSCTLHGHFQGLLWSFLIKYSFFRKWQLVYHTCLFSSSLVWLIQGTVEASVCWNILLWPFPNEILLLPWNALLCLKNIAPYHKVGLKILKAE